VKKKCKDIGMEIHFKLIRVSDFLIKSNGISFVK